MLASTMQISNNNPTNPRHPHNQEDTSEERNQKPNHTPDSVARQAMTADSSGPNSVLNPTPTNARHE